MFMTIKEDGDSYIVDFNIHRRNIPKIIAILLCLLLVVCLSAYVFYRYRNSDPQIRAGESQEDGLPHLSQEEKDELISIAYQAVDDNFGGATDLPEWPPEFNGIGNKVFIGFRIDGQKKGSWSSFGTDNLAHTAYLATQNTLSDTRFDGSLSETDVPDLKIEIFILGNESPFDENYEPGIHGIRIQKNDKGATFYNSVATEKNYDTDFLFERLCLKADLPEDCRTDEDLQIYYFPTIHIATTQFSDEVTTFYRCNTLLDSNDLTAEDLSNSISLAENALTGNLTEEGSFNYLYYPSTNTYAKSNNLIRQLMSSRLLGEMSSQDPSLKPLNKRNIDYIIETWYYEDHGLGYVSLDGRVKLGANAMAIRTIVASPYFSEYESYALKLADAVIAEQEDNGSMKAFLNNTNSHYDNDHLLLFYSGETILALTELYEKTKDEKYLDAAVKAQDYFFEKYITQVDTNYNPRYVPWHTISLAKLYGITGNTDYLNGVFTLNDRLIEMQHTTGEPYLDYKGRFYDPDHPEYGPPYSASSGIYLEGISFAYELAEQDNDRERMERYGDTIVLSVTNLINLQFRDVNMYYLEEPENAKGGFRANLTDNSIRIDNTQHALDAFRKIQELGVIE